MMLENDRQLANTQEKLRELQERYEQLKFKDMESERLRRMTLRSLKKMINQLTEEIVRYNCRHSVTETA
jgi:hypothetical protein